MDRSHTKPIILLVLLSLTLPALARTTGFISCLSSNNIKNFTLRHPSYYNDSEYNHFLYFSIQNLRFSRPTFPKPIAIVLPETKDQLASSITCIRQQGKWAIRIRSGGHSYEGLSYVSDKTPFVIVDMMNLNHVSVDMGSLTAWAEAGATLGEIYYAIANSSSSHGFSAGSCPTVGSGGHIGGGGFGVLSRKYGLAADNVVDAILVDSNGRFLDRETMGEDVFWAIRGGGGGIWGGIYAWKIKLLEVPKVITTFSISRPGTRRQVATLVHKWQFIAPNLEREFDLRVFVSSSSSSSSNETIHASASFNGFFLGSKTNMVSTINRTFPELQIVEEDFKEMSWIESVVFFSGLPNGSSIDSLKDRVALTYKRFFKMKSDYIREPIPLSGLEGAIKILEKEPKGFIILDPYGGAMDSIRSDAIPFPHRSGNLYSIQYIVVWNEEDDGQSNEFISWIRRFYRYMKHFASKGPRAAYVNYLDLDLGVMGPKNHMINSTNAVEIARKWGEKYFLANYDRLVRAKTIIDGMNVFSNQQGIPPLPLA